MLVEEAPASPLAMSKKYSSCPLKKRPVTLVREAPAQVAERPRAPPTPPTPTLLCTTLLYYDDVDENDEPENLSTKPEDLSKTGNYPSKASSPAATAATAAAPPPAPLRAWEPRCRSPGPPAPPPQYLCRTKLEPLNLHAETVATPTWHRPCPQYAPYLPLYSGEGFVPYGSALHAAAAERYSPYAPRGASRSPPAPAPALARRSPYSPPPSPHSASSYCSPPPPEDLTSPGSVSSDSGISASSASGKRRRDAAAPRYQCPDCAKSYSTYSGLSKHQQYHCAAAEGSLAKKSFSCKYCAKVYTSLGALKMHIRTHTLPCKCHLCGKAFSRPWLLQGHIRTHTGEKPFSCHHCRRAFADRSNLRAHLQTHSEVKKYSCGACSKTFSRMSLLSKHMEGGCGAPPSPALHPALHTALHYDYRPDELPAY